jgi:hypothetical protein
MPFRPRPPTTMVPLKEVDHMTWYVPVAGPDGVEWVDEDELSPEELSILGGHLAAIGSFLADATPETAERVEQFDGIVIAGNTLVTDLDRIEELAAEGQLEIEQFYEPNPPQ